MKRRSKLILLVGIIAVSAISFLLLPIVPLTLVTPTLPPCHDLSCAISLSPAGSSPSYYMFGIGLVYVHDPGAACLVYSTDGRNTCGYTLEQGCCLPMVSATPFIAGDGLHR